MKLLTVVGTRPELIRLSLVFRELQRAGVENHLVHTGQNYDPLLSDIFFEELELPAPDVYLEVKAETVGEQIGHIIARFGRVLLEERPITAIPGYSFVGVVIIVDSCSQICCSCASSHRVLCAVLMSSI